MAGRSAQCQFKKEAYPRAVFSEGLAIDYKWFDKWNIKPRYPFGHGLRWVVEPSRWAAD